MGHKTQENTSCDSIALFICTFPSSHHWPKELTVSPRFCVPTVSPSWSHCRGIYSELIHITYSCFLVSSLDKQPGLQTNTFYLHRYIATNDQDRRLVLLCSAHIGWSRLWILQAVMSQILCVHIFCISFMAEHTALYVFAKGHREVTAPTLHFILDDI